MLEICMYNILYCNHFTKIYNDDIARNPRQSWQDLRNLFAAVITNMFSLQNRYIVQSLNFKKKKFNNLHFQFNPQFKYLLVFSMLYMLLVGWVSFDKHSDIMACKSCNYYVQSFQLRVICIGSLSHMYSYSWVIN